MSLNQSEYLVVEQELSVEVCASLSGPIERTVLVELTSSPVTATDPAGVEYIASLNLVPSLVKSPNSHLPPLTPDYTRPDRTLTFTSDTTHCVDVIISDENVLETTETFTITVSSSDPDVSLGAVSSANILIFNDDSKLC